MTYHSIACPPPYTQPTPRHISCKHIKKASSLSHIDRLNTSLELQSFSFVLPHFVTKIKIKIRYVHPKEKRSFFSKTVWRTSVFLGVGPLIALLLTYGDVRPGFQSQGGFPRLRALSPACRCNSSVTLAELFIGESKGALAYAPLSWSNFFHFHAVSGKCLAK